MAMSFDEILDLTAAEGYIYTNHHILNFRESQLSTLFLLLLVVV